MGLSSTLTFKIQISSKNDKILVDFFFQCNFRENNSATLYYSEYRLKHPLDSYL